MSGSEGGGGGPTGPTGPTLATGPVKRLSRAEYEGALRAALGPMEQGWRFEVSGEDFTRCAASCPEGQGCAEALCGQLSMVRVRDAREWCQETLADLDAYERGEIGRRDVTICGVCIKNRQSKTKTDEEQDAAVRSCAETILSRAEPGQLLMSGAHQLDSQLTVQLDTLPMTGRYHVTLTGRNALPVKFQEGGEPDWSTTSNYLLRADGTALFAGSWRSEDGGSEDPLSSQHGEMIVEQRQMALELFVDRKDGSSSLLFDRMVIEGPMDREGGGVQRGPTRGRGAQGGSCRTTRWR